jgi:hypothetical protein
LILEDVLKPDDVSVAKGFMDFDFGNELLSGSALGE